MKRCCCYALPAALSSISSIAYPPTRTHPPLTHSFICLTAVLNLLDRSLPLPAGSDPVIPGVSDASSPGAGLPFVAMDADFRVDTAAVLAGASGGR